MNRRGFLFSLPFIAQAVKSVALSIALETAPLQIKVSLSRDLNDLWARATREMQARIVQRIAQTNPYLALFSQPTFHHEIA